MSQVESLEVRRLFVVNGTAGNDVIEILAVNEGDAFTYRVMVNGVTAVQETAPDDTFMLDLNALGGDDLITTDSSLLIKVRARGGDGNDTISGGSRPDILLGGEGNDLIFGGAGSDDLAGGGGDDTLRGGFGADNLRGDDYVTVPDYTANPGDDLLLGEDGEDLLYNSYENDTLDGGLGNDTVRGDGRGGDDEVLGGDGDDAFLEFMGSGSPTLDGGDGVDELVVESFNDPMYVTLDGVANDGLRGIAGGAGTNVLPTFEAFRSRGLGTGSVIDFSRATSGVTMRFLSATLNEQPSWVTLIGSPFADRFETTSPLGSVQLDGRDGDDTIFGGERDDTIVGGGGKDNIAAGIGDDVVYGDHDDGTPDYGSDTIEGNAGNDVLIGGGNNDVLIGQGGNDTLIGGGGNDRLFGGPGVDRIVGGPGNDTAEESEQDILSSL